MQYELYIDVFIFVNLMMDYFVLLIMRKALKCNATYFRMFAGAAVGAILSCLFLLLPFPEVLKIVFMNMMVSIIMLKISFGLRGKSLLQGWILLYVVSILMGGAFSFVNQYVESEIRNISLFLVISLVTYFCVKQAIEFMEHFWKVTAKTYKVTLEFEKEKICIMALHDTGNLLYDNITGQPVHIISAKGIKKFTKSIREVRYISYQTVQGESQVMPLVKLDRMHIHGKRKIVIENPYVGISKCLDFGNGDYELILHPDCIREDSNDDKNSS